MLPSPSYRMPPPYYGCLHALQSTTEGWTDHDRALLASVQQRVYG